jgi:hypothetical protein
MITVSTMTAVFTVSAMAIAMSIVSVDISAYHNWFFYNGCSYNNWFFIITTIITITLRPVVSTVSSMTAVAVSVVCRARCHCCY